jgi:hypothetical protein
MVLMSPTGGPSRCYHFFMDFLKVRRRLLALRAISNHHRPSAKATDGARRRKRRDTTRSLARSRTRPPDTHEKTKQCIEDNGENPPACKAWADDYLECLHHRRYHERKLEVEQERRRQEAAAASGGGHGHH